MQVTDILVQDAGPLKFRSFVSAIWTWYADDCSDPMHLEPNRAVR